MDLISALGTCGRHNLIVIIEIVSIFHFHLHLPIMPGGRRLITLAKIKLSQFELR